MKFHRERFHSDFSAMESARNAHRISLKNHADEKKMFELKEICETTITKVFTQTLKREVEGYCNATILEVPDEDVRSISQMDEERLNVLRNGSGLA